MGLPQKVDRGLVFKMMLTAIKQTIGALAILAITCSVFYAAVQVALFLDLNAFIVGAIALGFAILAIVASE